MSLRLDTLGTQKPKRLRNSPLSKPIRKICNPFTDEEKNQLTYLGSMLRQEPTDEEQEQQRILDAMDSPEWAKLIGLKDVKPQGGRGRAEGRGVGRQLESPRLREGFETKEEAERWDRFLACSLPVPNKNYVDG
jgi:hypothetical protein